MRPSLPHLPANLRSAIVAFVLTMGVVGTALYTGAAENFAARLAQTVDGEVVLLFAPLCALVFALTFEVIRIAVRNTVPAPHAVRRRAPRGWQPGRGEG